MIIKFSVQNYLSFKEKVTLDFTASSSKHLEENIISKDKLKLLKSIAIYGANASGKSNLLKALNHFRLLVVSSHNFTINNTIAYFPFKLEEKTRNEPSIFEIEFINKEIRYIYSLTTTTKVLEEKLYYYSSNNKQIRIFERINNSIYSSNEDKKEFEEIMSKTPENTLFLSRAVQFNMEKLIPVSDFFFSQLWIAIIYGENPIWEQYTIDSSFNNSQIKEKLLTFLKKADFSLEDFKYSKKKVIGVPINLDEKQKFNMGSQIETQKNDIRFIHKDSKGKHIEFGFNEESFGTQKLFSILGPIIEIITEGKILIFDELENSLHPDLMKLILELFTITNSNAQLIFTSHNTSIFTSSIFRKDQIWFTSKKEDSSTELYSLYEFKEVREGNADYEKQYLIGRFGAIPNIDRRLLSIIKQWEESKKN